MFHLHVVTDVIVESDSTSIPLDVSENMYKLVLEALEETSYLFDGRIKHIMATVSIKKTDGDDLDGIKT